jgi:hypothetical protein
MHSRSLLTLIAIYPSAALKLRPSVPALKSGSGYCAFGHAAPRAGVDVSEGWGEQFKSFRKEESSKTGRGSLSRIR